MKIARLDQRIELLMPQLSEDGYGGYATEYVKDKSVWAEVKESKFTGKQAFDTHSSQSSMTLRIRAYSSVRKGWHLRWQNREYEITSVERIYKDSVFLEISEYETGV